MLSLRRLLIATDLSANAGYTYRRARRLAHAFAAELHTLHVRTGRGEDLDFAALDTFSDVGTTGASRVRPPAIRYARTPADGILAYAEEHAIHFIAMGTQGRGGLKRWVVGSVAEAVVRRAPCPVLTIREGLAPEASDAGLEPPRRIVAAVDLEAGTGALLAHARAIADLAGARLDVLHVLEPPAAFRLFGVDGYRTALPRLATSAQARLQAEVERVPGQAPARCFVLTGDPERAVVRYAEAQHADLVFVGASGADGGLGSVTEGVMRQAPCPVFTLNATAASLVRTPPADAEADIGAGVRPLTPPPAIA